MAYYDGFLLIVTATACLRMVVEGAVARQPAAQAISDSSYPTSFAARGEAAR